MNNVPQHQEPTPGEVLTPDEVRRLMALFNDACRVAARSGKAAAGGEDFVTDSVLNDIAANPPQNIKFSSVPKFLALIKKVAFRRAVDRRRRQTRRGERIDPASVDAAASPVQRPGELHIAELNEVLDDLDPLERHVVNLRMQDLTFAKIATAMGIHERRAARVYESALVKLGELLDEP